MTDLQKTRRCARTLDRPITILGVEPEEMVFIGVVAALVMFLVDPLPAVVFGVGSAITLSRLKSGKPAGYLFYILYKSGWLRFVPGALRSRHLLPPPYPFSVRKIRLSAARSVKTESYSRGYWND
jgi:hypothetical protein